jgi:ribitol-5-phosphate 2-dehydrogenase (NADP+) / D-ribitol-5-phosphate cytidylyltransferase
MRTVAVVLAGGTGTRVGLSTPKQLLRVAGKPIIEHTIAALNASPHVDEILVMMASGYLGAVRDLLRGGEYPKVTRVLEGGETRNSTTWQAIKALGHEECNVLFHDAVRPLLSQRIIEDCVRALAEHDAVDTAIGSADTIIQVDRTGHTIDDILPRALLRRGQTPQGFRLSVIRRAYELATQDPDFQATDDCTVVLRYLPTVPIVVVRGEDRNMKITEPIDVYLADRLFQVDGQDALARRSADELRADLDGRTVVVFGGSYGIGRDVVEVAREHGATVLSFSRSTTQTYVERREDVVAARDRALAETGQVDYVINAAGVLPGGQLVGLGDDVVQSSTEINYLAPVYIAQAFHASLCKTRGSLLFFTSSSHTRGRSGYSLYSSAKAAVVNLTQALADEWAADGIRVNCINPERTATPMRAMAFGAEPEDSLLAPRAVAEIAVEVVTSAWTGNVVDARRDDSSGST